MSRATATFFRTLVQVHRWLGVAVSSLVLLWFISGIVMIYRSFPEITAHDRLARAPRLTSAQVRIPLEQAALAAGATAGTLRSVSSFDGRPAYRFSPSPTAPPGTPPTVVFADDGRRLDAIDDTTLDRAASQWSGQPIESAVRTDVVEVDQWTVGGRLRTMRPLFKYTWPDGQQVYVNGRTADVVQYTTSASRFWAYLGAVPHWLYFTPLRAHPEAWSSVVVWSSLVSTIGGLTGVVIGLRVYSPRRRHRYAGVPTSIPYRGWKRWHTMLGLLFGVLVTTWAFSGMLSMGPFPLVDRLAGLIMHGSSADAAADNVRSFEAIIDDALQGPPPALTAYEATSPADAIGALPDFDVRTLDLTSFDGQPAYVATNSRGERRVVPVNGAPIATFPLERVITILRSALGNNLRELRVLTDYDAYYRDRHHERSLPVVLVRVSDAAESRYYIDPVTALIADTYGAGDWVSRWLYHGLHSLDVPWLYTRRPLWDIVVIVLMLGGTAVAVTSVMLAWLTTARMLR